MGEAFCAGTALEWSVAENSIGMFTLLILERGPVPYMLQVNFSKLEAMRPMRVDAILEAMRKKWSMDREKETKQ